MSRAQDDSSRDDTATANARNFEAEADALQTRLADLQSLGTLLDSATRPLDNATRDFEADGDDRPLSPHSATRTFSPPPNTASFGLDCNPVLDPETSVTPASPTSKTPGDGVGDDESVTKFVYFSKMWLTASVVVALIAVLMTTIEFVTNLRNPLGVFAMIEQISAEIPVVTICPTDLGVPYFPEHTVAFPTRRIHDLYYFRLLGGTSCANKLGSCFGDYVESGWLSQASNVDCAAEFKEFSVSKFSGERIFKLPCRYCFRIGFKGGAARNTSESYLSKTETLQMQTSKEYFQCMLHPGGLSRSLLGNGRRRGTLNHEIKVKWRDRLRTAGVLQFDDAMLRPEENADFSSEVMCNILFFSGVFFPADNSSAQIKYRWSGSAWEQATLGPYFRLRMSDTLSYTLGYELYFQDAAHVEPEFPFAVQEGNLEKNVTVLGELPISTRILDAPFVVVGAFDMSFIALTRRLVVGEPSYSWRMNSFPVFVPPESPHTNNVEYGLNALVEEQLYYRSYANVWAWMENCFGWIGTFTGLSFFTALRRPMSKRIRRIRDAVAGTRSHDDQHRAALTSFATKRADASPCRVA